MISVNIELSGNNSSPNLFYHYTRLSSAIEGILLNKTIRFNSLEKTNDPLEFMKYVHYTSTMWETYKNNIPDEKLNKGREINRVIKKCSKILCGSIDFERNIIVQMENEIDDKINTLYYKGFCRARMWAQYAENYKGVCLVFNKDKLIKSIESFSAKTELKIFHSNIEYGNHLNGLTELFDLSNIDLDLHIEKYVHKNIKRYLFSKIEDYRDEMEYRFAILSNVFEKEEVIDIPYNDSIEGIIISVDFPKAYEINIEKYSVENNIPIFYLYWQNGKAQLYDFSEIKKYRDLLR